MLLLQRVSVDVSGVCEGVGFGLDVGGGDWCYTVLMLMLLSLWFVVNVVVVLLVPVVVAVVAVVAVIAVVVAFCFAVALLVVAVFFPEVGAHQS